MPPNEIIEQPRYVCAMGAQQTVLGIPRAIAISHAGPGCSSKLASALTDQAGLQGSGYAGGSAIPSTNVSENEVVFGGEEKLKSTIEGTLKVMDGDLFVVVTGCAADIIGDDVNQVVAEFRHQGIPIVNVETGGFKGNNYFGHELVLSAIIEQLLDETKPDIINGLVNVFSVVPFQNPFWRGDLEAIKQILSKLGLTVNILFGYDSAGFSEWQSIPKAQFNLLVSPWCGLSAVTRLKEKYGTPFLHWPTLPIGSVETTKFIKAVASFAGIDEDLANRITEAEEKRFYEYVGSAADFLSEARNSLPFLFHTVSDSTFALAFSKFLVNELGYTPGLQLLTDRPPEQFYKSIKGFFTDIDGPAPKIFFEEDGGKIQKQLGKALKNNPGTLILGSSWEKDLAASNNGLLLRVSLPIYDRIIMQQSYLGYRGGIRLLEEILDLVLSKGA